MRTTLLGLGLSGLAAAGGSAAYAQDARLTWGGSIEIGVDSTLSSDDPTAELTDTYLSADLGFAAALTDRITAFGTLELESVTDAAATRRFDDMGLYVSELGLRFAFGETLVSAGKISPVFGVAWDAAPGFYGTSLAGDYELSEMVGVTVDTPLGGTDGTLSLAIFHADDTFLSDSVGSKRGRNSTAAGGVGNTGKLDNAALQYTHDFGDTSAWVGARHLSAGVGDISDETGVVAGVAHDLGDGFDMIAEVAYFDGAGGTGTDATYATLGGAYALNDWTFSGTATVVDTDTTTDSMIALGIDRAITKAVEVNFGVARFDVGGVKSTAVGLAGVYAF